jgi:hypothetical protein
MYAKGKLIGLKAVGMQALSERVRTAVADDYPPEAWPQIGKDLHLVQAALATDRVIISNDRRARGAYQIASRRIRELGPICWVDPTERGDLLLPWLRGEAEAPRHWNLDPTREST